MKKKWKDSLLEGSGFPSLPVDFGFRDNTTFWFSKHASPYSEPIPKDKEIDVSAVTSAAKRTDPDVLWTEEACAKLINFPRIFLKKVLKGCVEMAKEKGVKTITPEFLDKIRDKRNEEKQN
jgi:histone H3/H4